MKDSNVFAWGAIAIICLLLAFDMFYRVNKQEETDLHSITRLAFEQREKETWASMQTWDCVANEHQIVMDMAKCQQGIELSKTLWPDYKEDRWKGLLAEKEEFPKIEDIVSVEIGKTADTHEWVITLRSADGKIVGFWTNGGKMGTNRVRSLTTY